MGGSGLLRLHVIFVHQVIVKNPLESVLAVILAFVLSSNSGVTHAQRFLMPYKHMVITFYGFFYGDLAQCSAINFHAYIRLKKRLWSAESEFTLNATLVSLC